MKKAKNGAGSVERRGTVQPFKDARGRIYYRARITLPDGERVWLKPRFDRRERAEEYADEKSREAEKREMTVAKMAPSPPKANGETCNAWHGRYLAYCKERGIVTTGDKGYRWKKWIGRHIGDEPVASVSRDAIETIRDALDAAILDGRIAPKTAQNAWGELTVSFGEACTSKRKDLKVRSDNPTSNVQPPETGVGRAKVYPYPSEFLRLVSSEAIPLEWREVHAIAAYTYARPGELWVLDWSDVDLEDEKIHITKAWDFKNKRVKSTKTWETRDIPIHPNLLPLLKRMHERAQGRGLVVPTLAATNPDKLSIITRKHFEVAECKRARLFKDTEAERHVVFRSWRDAGCTWAIVEGTDVIKVQRRAGHKLISTTQRYVIEAENRGAAFGTAFPKLPACLLESSKCASKDDAVILQATGTDSVSPYRRRDSNTQPEAASSGISLASDGGSPSDPPQPASDNPVIPGRLDTQLDAVETSLSTAIAAATAAGKWELAERFEARLEAHQRGKAHQTATGLALPRRPQRQLS